MIRTTIVGGLLALVPLGFLVVVLEKAWLVAQKVAGPVSAILPEAARPVLVSVAASFLILAFCFLSGLAVRHSIVKSRVAALDSILTDSIPGYIAVKSTISGFAESEESEGLLSAVLVRFDDYWQVAFEVERDGDHATVFLPGSPSVWSGTTIIVETHRISPLNAPLAGINRAQRVLGRGTLGIAGRAIHNGAPSGGEPAGRG
jgi:uncharacterized membrane protein